MAFAMGRENGDWLCVARPPAGSGGGLKWQTWQTFAIPKSRLSSLESGGREGIRTPGLLVANEALSQLSYSPTSSTSSLANASCLANARSSARKHTGVQHAAPLLLKSTFVESSAGVFTVDRPTRPCVAR